MQELVKVQSKTVADVVSERIQQLILGGSIKPADKLPSERKLALEFDVSRVSLRQGIAKLEEIGLLIVKKDGTYVCDVISPSLLDPFEHLFDWYPKALYDMFELRKVLSMAAAEFAAERVCHTDTKILKVYFSKFEEAIERGNEKEILKTADQFHLAIADCSYNLLLATVLRSITYLLRTAKQHNGIPNLAEFHSIQSYLLNALINKNSKNACLAIEQTTLIYHSIFATNETQATAPSQPLANHSINIDKIAARIEHLIICGHYDILKNKISASAMSVEMQQTEADITAALNYLVHRNLLVVKEGNYYINDDQTKSLISEPLVHLMQADEKIAYSVLELRIILEKFSAQSAASNQDKNKQTHLKRCLERLITEEQGQDTSNQSLNDYEFHLAIADMSDNLALTYLMRGLFNLLRLSINNWLVLFNKEIGDSSIIAQQHNAIYQAIIKGNQVSASDAMYEHLQFVADTMKDILARKEREVFAEQRWRFINN